MKKCLWTGSGKKAIFFAGIILACQPIMHADWRDYLPFRYSLTAKTPTRRELTDLIWSKYGAIGGAIVALLIAGGVWIKWGRKEETAKRLLDELDAQYATQNLPSIFRKFPREMLIDMLVGPRRTRLLCYALMKENATINWLMKNPQQWHPKFPELNNESLKLISTNLVLLANLAGCGRDLVKYLEMNIVEQPYIITIVMLDVLYAIQRWEDMESFISLLNDHLGIQQPNYQKLIEAFRSNKEKIQTFVTTEVKRLEEQDILFVTPTDRDVILRLLNHLITLTSEK